MQKTSRVEAAKQKKQPKTLLLCSIKKLKTIYLEIQRFSNNTHLPYLVTAWCFTHTHFLAYSFAQLIILAKKMVPKVHR